MEELLKRIQKLQSTEEPATPELFAARAREGRLVHVSTDEVEFQQAGDGGSGGGTSDLEPSLSDGDKDAHLSSPRSSGQEVWGTPSTTAHPEGHDHGDGDTVSHHPLENHTGFGSPSCQRDEGTVAPTESLRALATGARQNALGQHSQDTTRPAPGQNAGSTLMEPTTPPLRTLQNPAAACYMNSAVTGLAWSALQADGLKVDQWSNFPGVLGELADVSKGQPLLLWSDGQWTSLPANWSNPFRQHDVVDFAHHLLQQTNPFFLSCCWESRLAAGGGGHHEGGGPQCPRMPFASIHLQ